MCLRVEENFSSKSIGNRLKPRMDKRFRRF